MKKKYRKESERGQIIILLAVSMVVVVVVAALAVDGGMVYSERRFAQNAADAAGFAGGGAVLNSGKIDTALTCPANSSFNSGSGNFNNSDNLVAIAIMAAQTRASANNISSLPYLGYRVNDVVKEDFGLDENQGIYVECHDNDTVKVLDVFVRVTSQVSTAFAHLIYPGPLQTTNEAVVSVTQEVKVLNSDAIISLSLDCTDNGKSGGLLLHNNGLDITVINGGAFSNSCLSVKNQSSSSIDIDGKINIVGEITGTHPNQPIIVDNTNKNQTPLPVDFPNPPNPKDACAKLGNIYTSKVQINKDTTLSEGYYKDGIKITGGPVHFEEGLYCVDGEFDINGGPVTGGNVTFYLSNGTTIKNNGNASIKLVAPTKTDNPFYGLLFYVEGTGGLVWNGSSDSHYNGLVYAPKRNIDFSGNSNNSSGTCPEITGLDCSTITYPTQIVGYQITFAGSSTINITNPKDGAKTLQNNLYLKN